ncbi:MAG: extracellular solute-binding protein, partial [Thermoflexia bacterium]
RIRYTIPREGSSIWMDHLCIPASAPNKEAAHLFINYLLRPDVGARISNYTRYASPNAAARAHIDPELLADPAVYPPPEVLERLEWTQDVGETTLLYERIWTEVKAATP